MTRPTRARLACLACACLACAWMVSLAVHDATAQTIVPPASPVREVLPGTTIDLHDEPALRRFYEHNKASPAAARTALEAAHQVARQKQSAGDPKYRDWLRATVTAWEFLRAHGAPDADGRNAALSPPFADEGAEAEFTLDDEAIGKAERDSGHGQSGYAGTPEEVLAAYARDVQAAQDSVRGLEHIARTYPSPVWVVAAVARTGAVFDALRIALAAAAPPRLRYFTKQQETLLAQLEGSGRDDLVDRADELRAQTKSAWQRKRQGEIESLDRVVVGRYATAEALARKFDVDGPWVARARARLAEYTALVGDAKMREYVTATTDPGNPSGAPSRRLDYRDGQYLESQPHPTRPPEERR